MSDVISVLIVEDHELVRAGVQRLLEDSGYPLRFCQVATGEAALNEVKRQHVDIVFLDLSLPGISGVEVAMSLLRSHREIKIIIITAATELTFTRKLLQTGVLGYLTKNSNPRQMERAMREALSGNVYVAPDVAKLLEQNSKSRSGVLEGSSIRENAEAEEIRKFDCLSKREYQIVYLLVRGKNNRQIASDLFISEKTVSTHRIRAFRKMQVSSLAELATMAFRVGLLERLTPVTAKNI